MALLVQPTLSKYTSPVIVINTNQGALPLQTIWVSHQLNEKQKSDIEALVQECFAFDGVERTLYLSNDLNYYEKMDCFYLLYSNERLVSVLSIVEILEREAEISAYTLPKERNKGYFTALLGYAKDELTRYEINKALFVVEPSCESGIAAVNALQARYEKSEYLLIRPNHKEQQHMHKPEDIKEHFVLRELDTHCLEKAATLSSKLFGTDVKEDISILKEAMESDQMKTFCSFLSGKMIGITSVNYGIKSACIFDFGIAAKYQGKGYGRKQLDLLLSELSSCECENIILEVGSENKKAFSLYQSAGFQIKTQYDYYELQIK